MLLELRNEHEQMDSEFSATGALVARFPRKHVQSSISNVPNG